MSLPEIPAVDPTIIPAVPEQTFAGYWLQKLHVEGRPEGAVRLYAEMKPYDKVTGTCSPASVSDVVVLELPSIFGLTDPEMCPELTVETRQAIGVAMAAVLDCLARVGRDRGTVA